MARSKRGKTSPGAAMVMQTMDNQTVEVPADLSAEAARVFTTAAQQLAQQIGVPLDAAADALYKVVDATPKNRPRVVVIRDAYDQLLANHRALSTQLRNAAAAGPGAMAGIGAGASSGGVYVKHGAGWQNVAMNVSAQVGGLGLAAQSTPGTVPQPSLRRRPPVSASPTSFGLVTCPHCRIQVPADEYVTIGDRAAFTGCRTCVNQYAARMRDLVAMSAAFANFAHFARAVQHWYRSLPRSAQLQLAPELRAQIDSIGTILIAAERMQLQERFATTAFPESAIEQQYNLVDVSLTVKREPRGLDQFTFSYAPSERARSLALYLLDAYDGLYPLLREIAESLSDLYAQRQLAPPILTLAYCDRRATLYEHEPFLLLDVQTWSASERDALTDWTSAAWMTHFAPRVGALDVAPRLILAWQFAAQIPPARHTSTLWEPLNTDDASRVV